MERPVLIAECAKEHGGNIEVAKAMIREAKRSEFDYVKFQAYSLTDLEKDHPNYLRYVKSWLSLTQLKELKQYADDLGIGFYCSVFSESMIKPLSEFTDIVKVPSTYCNHKEFIQMCLNYFKKVHISTGMHGMPATEELFENAIYYHCISEYPTARENAQLGAITEDIFIQGYSDHTGDIETLYIAWLVGAEFIEVHFSIKSNPSPWTYNIIDMFKFNRRVDAALRILGERKVSEKEKENYEFYKKEYKTLRPIR